MKIWYARVSTTGQSLDIQIERLTGAGCEKLFQEKKTGSTRAVRQQLTNALDFVREGDVLMVTRLDRLARSVPDLLDITRSLEAKQVDLIVFDQDINTSSPTWRLLFHMLAAIGEFERDLINERAAEGIARAKANGVKFGPKRKLSDGEISELKEELKKPGVNKTGLARKYGISWATLYRAAKKDD